MDAELLHRLRTPPGVRLLDAAYAAYPGADPLALSTRVRRLADDPALVSAALTQARLRYRAAAKFGSDAARMFFTQAGYEQATRAGVARHRATRLAEQLGPDAHVLDLCCGIGGDLIALARAGLRVTGVERDPLTAAAARANVQVLGLEHRAQVLEGDATSVDLGRADAVVCDPSRRTERGRTFDPDAYSPPWSFVERLLTRTACVKVAPGIPHDRIPPGVEAEWVSDGGDVTEAALWAGSLPLQGIRHRATLLPADVSLTEQDDPGFVADGPPLAFLYEPDGAVIRAGLVTAVAAIVDGRLLDERIAYVTSDALVRTPFARAYTVRESIPFDEKVLRAWTRTQHIGSLTIKKRGVGVEPEALRKRLKLRGDAAATLVITRVRERASVLVVEPVLPTPHG